MTTQTRNDGRSNAMLGSMVSNDKFCGITKFSGEDKTYSSAKWAADIEDNAKIFGWSARQKLIVARQSLVGTAQLWLRSEETYKTFEELNAALQNEFPDELNLNSKEMHEHRYPEEENDSHRHNSCEEEPEEQSDSQEISMSNSFEDDVNKQSLHNEKEKLMNICKKSSSGVGDKKNDKEDDKVYKSSDTEAKKDKKASDTCEKKDKKRSEIRDKKDEKKEGKEDEKKEDKNEEKKGSDIGGKKDKSDDERMMTNRGTCV
ncbi:cylicin-1-like [Plutella xylostella]|uniref:cylicin-1-like n=1 Tax=Plutella xylostella TaxID=51655 RepID=UPI002032B21A|nr:cylicin-1-like [Plutella xylostella]